jgi:hypothetical protein
MRACPVNFIVPAAKRISFVQRPVVVTACGDSSSHVT